ncbi:hypothetical protein ACN47E_003339 [Coniothyrium glycines]
MDTVTKKTAADIKAFKEAVTEITTKTASDIKVLNGYVSTLLDKAETLATKERITALTGSIGDNKSTLETVLSQLTRGFDTASSQFLAQPAGAPNPFQAMLKRHRERQEEARNVRPRIEANAGPLVPSGPQLDPAIWGDLLRIKAWDGQQLVPFA